MEHARTIFCVKLSINNHIVGLVHKNHIIRTRLMYCCTTQLAKLSFNHSNGCTQLTFSNLLPVSYTHLTLPDE